MKGFNLQVPKKIEGVDEKILMPINSWENKEEYNQICKKFNCPNN